MKSKFEKLTYGVLILSIIVFISAIIYKNNDTISDAINLNLDNIINIDSHFNSTVINSYEEYYASIEESLKNYNNNLTIKIKNYDEDVYNVDVINEVLEKNPELMGIYTNCRYTVENSSYNTKIEFDFNYSHNKETLLARNNELINKINDIVNELIKPEMTDYEKEKVLHDYIINNAKYDERYFTEDMPHESYTAYGALISGKTVCQGYAVAMDMLLKAAGIESIVIYGESLDYTTNEYGPHSWNLIKLDDEYYHLDLTWDDPITEDGSDIISYSYFNITDNQISVNHKWDRDKYPKCTASKYNFTNLNFVEKDVSGNDIIAVQNYDELYFYIQEDLLEMRSGITYRISNFDEDLEKIQALINDAYASLSKSGEYYFNYKTDEMTKCGYITIFLK